MHFAENQTSTELSLKLSGLGKSKDSKAKALLGLAASILTGGNAGVRKETPVSAA